MNCESLCVSQGIEPPLCKKICTHLAEDQVTPIFVSFLGPSLPNLFIGITPSLTPSLQPIPSSRPLYLLVASTRTRSILISRSSSLNDLVTIVPLHLDPSPDKTSISIRLDPPIPKSDHYSVGLSTLAPTTIPKAKALTCPFAIGILPSPNWSIPQGAIVKGFPSWKWLVFGLALTMALVLFGICLGGYLHSKKDMESNLEGFKHSLNSGSNNHKS